MDEFKSDSEKSEPDLNTGSVIEVDEENIDEISEESNFNIFEWLAENDPEYQKKNKDPEKYKK